MALRVRTISAMAGLVSAVDRRGGRGDVVDVPGGRLGSGQ
jgi:hypothetical protein